MKAKVTPIKPKKSAASPPEFRPEFSPEGFEIMLNLLCERTAAAIRQRQAQEQKVG